MARNLFERNRPSEDLLREMGKPRANDAAPWVAFEPGENDLRRLAAKAEQVLARRGRFSSQQVQDILARLVLGGRA